MELMTLATFIFFTALVGILTYFITRNENKNSSIGYFLGNRSLSAGMIAGSLLMTNLSTEQLVGLNGAAFRYGLSVMAWEVIAAIALVIMALFFLPNFLRSGIATIPQFLEERFDKNTRNITSIIFIVAYTGILLPLILYSGATGMVNILNLEKLTGLSYSANITLLVWIIGLIGSFYAIFGGLKSVAVSDTINGFGLLIGGFAIVYLGFKYIGGEEGALAGYAILRNAIPEKLNSISDPQGDVPFYTLFSGVFLLNLFYWCTNQQIIQRTFGAINLAEGQKGVLLAGSLKIFGPLILVFPGLIAFYLYKEGILTLPLDASGGPKADTSYGLLVQTVMPNWMTGFFAASLLGAILSSFNSALNSTCTLFSLGVYKRILKPDASDANVISVGKKFGWIIAFFSMIIAPLLLGQDSIFSYLQTMNAIYFVPIFSVVLVGLTSKKTPAFAANIGMLFAFAIICAVYFIPGLNITDKNSDIFLMHNFHFIAFVLIFSVALTFAIGALCPLPSPWKHHYTQEVDLTEWKFIKPASLALTIAVFVIYASFADLSVIGEVGVIEKIAAALFIIGVIASIASISSKINSDKN